LVAHNGLPARPAAHAERRKADLASRPMRQPDACSRSEVAMNTPLLIVLTVVVLGAGSALAVMNNACNSPTCLIE